MRQQNIFYSIHVFVALFLLHLSAHGHNPGTNENQTTHSQERRFTGNVDLDRPDPNIPAYVPGELLVKFGSNVSNALEASLKTGVTAEQILSGSALEHISKKYEVLRIEPIFKDYKKQQARLQLLSQSNWFQLGKSEQHILKRLQRAPQNVSVPALDRIYKLKIALEDNQTLEQVVAAYNSNPEVEYAELNYIVSIDLTPNDPHYSIQWPLNNTGQMYPASGGYNDPPGTADADIDAPKAWDIQNGSSEIIVAVADTGVDYNHRDIDDNMWTSSSGYHGYDFVNNDNYPMDDHGHGTHCAGIVSAETNNGLDIAGVCWNTKIMALKFLDENGSGTYADAADAFYYATNQGADVISNSWGKDDFSQTMQDAINYAHSQGVIIVAAAGNDNQFYFPHYPASMERVISVAATNSDDEKASLTNYGDWIDICAPGIDVLSLRANGTSMGTIYDSYTTVASGTSMACPHVAGVLGLLLSQYPDISTDEIVARLLSGADDISAENAYYQGLLGSGRLNAYKSLRFNHEGMVVFDRNTYGCEDTMMVNIFDFDIRNMSAQQVTLTTTDGDSETLTLLQDPNRPWLFDGTINTCVGAIISGNGRLEVSDGQTITVSYIDPNYGDYGPVTVEDTADIDCEAPYIFNVQVHSVTSSGARVRFQTNEPTTARIQCGQSCGSFSITAEDIALSKGHDIYIPGLTSETTYHVIIDANDIVGNACTDDNAGLCYSFTTEAVPSGLRVPVQYPTIQAAINAATNGQIIWVADGVYTGSGNRDIEFYGKAITVRSENGSRHCIIDCQANESDNHYGFYFSYGEDPDSVVDGFTITGAYNSSHFTNGGAGIVCDRDYNGPGGGSGGCHPTISNCVIKENIALVGGGIACINSHPIISNSLIMHNEATYMAGGGIYAHDGSSPSITDCMISYNKARYKGGGIYCTIGSPTIKNCLITCNRALISSGGGISGWANSKPKIINCTLNGNSAGYKGAGIFTGSNVVNTVKNCILWDNGTDEISVGGSVPGYFTVEYSNIKGGCPGDGNINLNPLFSSLRDSDYHLCSQNGRWDLNTLTWVQDDVTNPCIDTGDSNSDWTAELWPHGKRINMGAYGGTAEASMSTSLVGNISDLDLNDVVNLLDFGIFAKHWLNNKPFSRTDFDRDMDIDILDLKILVENWLWQE